MNRKDKEGEGLFEGGFLGLDNISVFDRSHAKHVRQRRPFPPHLRSPLLTIEAPIPLCCRELAMLLLYALRRWHPATLSCTTW